MAVKVRHPGVSQAIQRDFALMMRMARIASLVPFIRELRLEDTLAQFAAPLREQVGPSKIADLESTCLACLRDSPRSLTLDVPSAHCLAVEGEACVSADGSGIEAF